MKGFVDLVKESVDFSDVKKAASSNSSQPLDLIATSVKIEITPTRPTSDGTTPSQVDTQMVEKLKDQIMKGVNSVIDLKPAGDNMPTKSTITVVKVSGSGAYLKNRFFRVKTDCFGNFSPCFN